MTKYKVLLCPKWVELDAKTLIMLIKVNKVAYNGKLSFTGQRFNDFCAKCNAALYLSILVQTGTLKTRFLGCFQTNRYQMLKKYYKEEELSSHSDTLITNVLRCGI